METNSIKQTQTNKKQHWIPYTRKRPKTKQTINVRQKTKTKHTHQQNEEKHSRMSRKILMKV